MPYIFLLWLSESLTLSFRYKHLILSLPVALWCASQVNKMCTWISLDGFITICALCETHRLSTFPGFIWAVNPKQLQQNAPSNHLHRIYPHRSPSIVLAGLFVSDCDLPPSTQYYFISLRFSFVTSCTACVLFLCKLNALLWTLLHRISVKLLLDTRFVMCWLIFGDFRTERPCLRVLPFHAYSLTGITPTCTK